MQHLRVITIVLVVVGFGALFSYPFTVGAPPKQDAPIAARKAYALRLTIFFGVTSFSLLGAALGSALIARRIRRQFAEKALGNFANLLGAGHLQDPEKDESGRI
ncbi:MAG: hypothetical protein H0W86_05750 [Armatimonadetes bacterium]|nr:hypothetical protein [Armatimonadota bacterium]